MGFFGSLRKSWRLRSISRRLGKNVGPDAMVEELLRGGGRRAEREAALDDLLDVVESDPDLQRILVARGVNRQTLRDLYGRLLATGAGQWVGGHWAAASALLFGGPLDFLLRTRDSGNPRAVAFRIIEYFERGEVGRISESEGGRPPSQTDEPPAPDRSNALGAAGARLERKAKELVPAASILATKLHAVAAKQFESTGEDVDFQRWRFFATVAGVEFAIRRLALEVPEADFGLLLDRQIFPELERAFGPRGKTTLWNYFTMETQGLAAMKQEGASAEDLEDMIPANLAIWILESLLGRKVDASRTDDAPLEQRADEIQAAFKLGNLLAREFAGYWK